MDKVIRTLAVVLLSSASLFARAPEEQKRREIAIAVQYDAVLIVSTEDGVAAYSFTKRVDKCTEYKFRFRSKDGGKEQSGTGKVQERYRAIQGADANDVSYIYDGGDLDLKAGPIEIRWSRGDDKSGWIYYDAEKVQTHTAKAPLFDTLDLKQFAK